MPDRERKRVPDDWVRCTERTSHYVSFCTPLGQGKPECPRLNKENEKENRDEASHRGVQELYQRKKVWKQVRAILYRIWLLIGSQ